MDITVDYATSDGTATAGPDYTSTSGTATGVDDAIYDGDRTFSIVLGAATSADSNYYPLNPADVSVTNTDNESAPTAAFDSGASSGAEAVSPANLAVSISVVSTQTVTVDNTVTGTATGSGTDYTLADGTLTFDAGTITQNISAIIVDDSIEKTDETMIATLSNLSNSTLGTNTVHTYTILNDDDNTPPTVPTV